MDCAPKISANVRIFRTKMVPIKQDNLVGTQATHSLLFEGKKSDYTHLLAINWTRTSNYLNLERKNENEI